MSKSITYERDPRSYDDIMLAARRMRAEYIRELFGKLRRALFSGRASDAHAQGLTPHAR